MNVLDSLPLMCGIVLLEHLISKENKDASPLILAFVGLVGICYPAAGLLFQ
jgi:hypothetical protein